MYLSLYLQDVSPHVFKKLSYFKEDFTSYTGGFTILLRLTGQRDVKWKPWMKKPCHEKNKTLPNHLIIDSKTAGNTTYLRES